MSFGGSYIIKNDKPVEVFPIYTNHNQMFAYHNQEAYIVFR